MRRWVWPSLLMLSAGAQACSGTNVQGTIFQGLEISATCVLTVLACVFGCVRLARRTGHIWLPSVLSILCGLSLMAMTDVQSGDCGFMAMNLAMLSALISLVSITWEALWARVRCGSAMPQR